MCMIGPGTSLYTTHDRWVLASGGPGSSVTPNESLPEHSSQGRCAEWCGGYTNCQTASRCAVPLPLRSHLLRVRAVGTTSRAAWPLRRVGSTIRKVGITFSRAAWALSEQSESLRQGSLACLPPLGPTIAPEGRWVTSATTWRRRRPAVHTAWTWA